jgi:hypothetical protein
MGTQRSAIGGGGSIQKVHREERRTAKQTRKSNRRAAKREAKSAKKVGH